MSSPLSQRGPIVAMGIITVLLLLGAGAIWWSGQSPPPGLELPVPPGPESAVYEEYVEAFQVGLASLDADLPQVAREKLSRAIELVPLEPAGWANRGLLHLRSGQIPEATHDLEEAARLAPDNPDVQKLLGLLHQRGGRFGEAAEILKRAIERDPDDVQALFLLAQIIDQEQKEGSDAEYQRLMENILTISPDNLRVLLERLRLAVRRADAEAVRETLSRFDQLAPNWLERTRKALDDLKPVLADSLGPQVVPRLLLFSNVLRAERGFPRSAAEVDPQQAYIGRSLQHLVWLPPVRPAPAPPDMQLTFAADSSATFPDGRWDVVLPVWLTGAGQPMVLTANAHEVRITDDNAVIPTLPALPEGIITLDWNNDARTDLLLAGSKGVLFSQQEADGTFTDQTARTGLADEILHGDFHAALAADVDLDGDLDVLLSQHMGTPLWLRNNFDGTFTAQPIFAELNGPKTFIWADFDHDGAPDAALLGADGQVHLFANERSGQFRAWPVALPKGRMLAMTSADANDDGVFDLIALRDDGKLLCLSDRDKRSAWETSELAQWKAAAGGATTVTLLMAADFDNNGALDLLASGPKHSALWVGAGHGRFQLLEAKLPPRLQASADLRISGRLDLLGVDREGRPFQLRNTGHQDYHWQTVRPQAAGEKVEGDNRINSFGIGGTIEIRTGTQIVKQPIRSPAVHFGLGTRPRADVIRIEWPNGTFQYEFSPRVDQSMVALQRLKGSCPFLFAWNGKQFDFVTDFMWSTPLGMYINASDKGGFLQTTDWVKVPGEMLVPQDGRYELRVNANLWETHFFDHLALIAIDHPADTEMFVDERFCLEPSDPTLRLTSPPQPIARAWDHKGRDATAEVLVTDGVHLDRAGRGPYQGVTNDHWVEFEVGDDLLGDGPLWLLARGWVHPTDSSVNYALEQGDHIKPRGLVLEVPDGRGDWKIGRDRLGFPAGKNKTILVRLDGLNGEAIPKRFRLRTNMEIYWDSLQIARGRDDDLARRTALAVDRSELRFRGIIAMTQANPSSPELPHYDEVIARGQHWRDLIGYHTRYGEIGELLEKVDDRYVILGGGDEVILHFQAPADPPTSWKRDFVWVADGWVKDGDLNTRFGKTVLPLPAHDLSSYDVAPGDLTDDPVFRRHSVDWDKYHTRYVTPELYERGLRPRTNRRTP